MWTHSQSGGTVTDPTGKIAGSVYSGRGEGKNNPIMQDIHGGCRSSQGEWVPVDGLSADDWGPLPQGFYTIQPPVDTATHGPFVLWLTPDADNEMYGRSAFGIHGDEANTLQIASEGCIVAYPGLRHLIAGSEDVQLQVIS